MTAKEFVEKYYPAAKASEAETGVPALATLAQAALESGWGAHAPGYNFFGIKTGRSWNKDKQFLWTKEFVNNTWKRVQACFRKYNSAAESFTDHGLFIKQRFPKAFGYTSPIMFIRSMQTEHGYKYATDPAYIENIALIMTTLKKFIKE